MEELEKINVDDIVKNETSIKDIFNTIVQNFVTIIVVGAVVYLALSNNSIDVLKNSFEVIIGFYIGSKGVK